MPQQKCYLMVGWYYPAGGGKLPGANKYTIWDFYVAAHPWGPWNPIGSQGFMPMGFYCPEICTKFTSPDGSKAWVFTARQLERMDGLPPQRRFAVDQVTSAASRALEMAGFAREFGGKRFWACVDLARVVSVALFSLIGR